MTPERWQRVREIFQSALEREPSQRAAFLAGACAGDEALRRQVDSLIASHEQAENFIEAPVFEKAAAWWRNALGGGNRSEVMMRYCTKCRRSYPNTQRICLDDGERLSLKDPYNFVGRTIMDKYRIEALVGIGGMGAVYRAHQIGVDRCVAFKMLLPNLALNNERIISLFEREARMAGQLFHENIAIVFDAGRTADDIVYIVMEWLDGQTLEEDLFAGDPLSFKRTGEILRQIAAALAAAHAKKIIHRDLKPANVMLTKRPDGGDQVKVLDFGIAKAISETTDSPVSAVMGTPFYASPEQFQLGAHIDGRTDIYSLGVILYRMLTGTLPFIASSVHELIHLQMTRPPQPIRQLRPDAPTAIEQLIARMLAKDQDQRPQFAREVWELFSSALKLKSLGQSQGEPKDIVVTEVASGRDVIRDGGQASVPASSFTPTKADTTFTGLSSNAADSTRLERVIKRLIDNLHLPDPEDRAEAAKALGNIEHGATAAIPALIEALKDPATLVRQSAASSLGAIGPEAKAAIPALIEALEDQSASVRRDASKSIGRIGPEAKAAVPALIEALKDPTTSVRQSAISALGGIWPEAKMALPSLLRALDDKDELVRNSAALTLGKIGAEAKAAVPALIEALRDQSILVRVCAAYALSGIGPEAAAAIPALTEALKDQNEAIQESAAAALHKIKPRT